VFMIDNAKFVLPTMFVEVHKKEIKMIWLSQPRQGFAKVQAKSEIKNHMSCSRECGRMWKNEPLHSQMSSHFGSWNPGGLPNF
jgi:hypothetical protein